MWVRDGRRLYESLTLLFIISRKIIHKKGISYSAYEEKAPIVLICSPIASPYHISEALRIKLENPDIHVLKFSWLRPPFLLGTAWFHKYILSLRYSPSWDTRRKVWFVPGMGMGRWEHLNTIGQRARPSHLPDGIKNLSRIPMSIRFKFNLPITLQCKIEILMKTYVNVNMHLNMTNWKERDKEDVFNLQG